jgi:hypothetical protein
MAGSIRAFATMACATTLVACGHSSGDPSAAGRPQQQNREAKAGRRGAELADPDMVTAVSSARSTTPINMKFALSARPVVGTPVTVTVALIPAADVGINHIHASFQPGDGLQLTADRVLDVNSPEQGQLIEQQLSVVPQQAGVLLLNATVLVDTDGGSIARGYTIPVIAGDNTSSSPSP